MPTYYHECTNEECKHEWEDFYSITKDPPTTCPACSKETAKRVISGGNGRGIMQLSDDEFKANLPNEIAKIKKEMHGSEKVYANMLGEAKYEQMQRKMDAAKKDRRR